MNNQLSMPCPDCNTNIFFNPQMLLQGAQFSCPKCYASIGLAAESKQVVQESLEKFEKMKTDVLKSTDENPQF